MRAALNPIGTVMALLFSVLAITSVPCPDPAGAADTEPGPVIDPSYPSWAAEDLALPKVLERSGQGDAGHEPAQPSEKCSAGEPVDPSSLDTDQRPTAPRGKPFGISLDEAFLPISFDMST